MCEVGKKKKRVLFEIFKLEDEGVYKFSDGIVVFFNVFGLDFV